jgi:prefoldin subunit 5
MSAVDPFKEIEELAARAERLQEQADGVKAELAEKRTALQARLDSIAPTARRVSPMRKRGENLAAVKAALADGVEDIKQIAERVNITPSAVRMYLDKLKEVDEGDEDDDEPEAKAAPPPAPPPIVRLRANLEGDSIDEVRAAVLKQGGKGRVMVTAGADGHTHVAEVDRHGTGITTAGGKDRHFHVVKDFVPRPNSGAGPSVHRHELTKQAADS